MRSHWGVILVMILVLGVVSGSVTGTQDSYSVSIDVPTTATAGESVSIGGSITVPERPGDWSTEVDVTLRIDGERVGQRTVTVQDGETTSVQFSHTFDRGGDHQVTIKGETSFGSWSYSDTATANIRVQVPDTPTTTPEIPDSTPTRHQGMRTGAAFPVPEGLADEVEQYRSASTGELPGQTFVLATQDRVYLVFTNTAPRKAVATVQGSVLTKEATTVDGITYGAIAATSVQYDTSTRDIALADLEANPGTYAFQHVKLTSYQRSLSVRADPDSAGDIDSPSTVTALYASEPQGIRKLSQAATQASINASKPSFISGEPGVWAISSQRRFWSDGRATISGIVLPPDSAAKDYVQTVDQGGATATVGEGPVLATTEISYATTAPGSVEALANGDYVGETVVVESEAIETQLSTQELLTQSSACGDTMVMVKEACVPVPNDVVVHSGVAWDEGVSSRGAAVVFVGAAATRQEEISTVETGRYRIVGKVVSSRQLDGSLPDRRALLVYEMERLGDSTSAVPIAVESLHTQLNQSLRTSLSTTESVRANPAADQPSSESTADQRTVTSTQTPGDSGTRTSENDGGFAGGPLPSPAGPGFGVPATLVAILCVVALRWDY